MSASSWATDLSIGAKFGVAGGREGWMRTLLTAVGVGLGVAVLLFTTAVPGALSARDQRSAARDDFTAQMTDKRGDTTLQAITDTQYGMDDVRGRLVHGESAAAPVPPGLGSLPATGTMVVSPPSGPSSTPPRASSCASASRTRTSGRSPTPGCSARTNSPTTGAWTVSPWAAARSGGSAPTAVSSSRSPWTR